MKAEEHLLAQKKFGMMATAAETDSDCKDDYDYSDLPSLEYRTDDDTDDEDSDDSDDEDDDSDDEDECADDSDDKDDDSDDKDDGIDISDDSKGQC